MADEEKAGQQEAASQEEKKQEVEQQQAGQQEEKQQELGLGEGEPKGDSPEAVFARKQYREAKEAKRIASEKEREAQQEREARIRLEEQLKAKETTSKETKIFSLREVNQAVREGRISQEEADEYFEGTLLPYKMQQLLEGQRQKEAQQKPVEKALNDIEEYKGYFPSLNDTTSEDFQKVVGEMRRLINDRGMQNNFITQAVAVENIFGRLSEIKKRQEMDTLTRGGSKPAPTDAGANSGTNGAQLDLSKAPQTMRDYWERTNTPEASRRKEFQIWKDLKASGRRF